MIAENQVSFGEELDRPEYDLIVDANGHLGDNTRGRRDYVDLLFGIDGGIAEIILLSYNNKPIDEPHQSPDKVTSAVKSFITDNYDVNYVRLSEK
jgi:hypothetical protein